MGAQIAKFISFTRLPKVQVAIFLGTIATSAILFGNQPDAVRSIVLAVIFCLLADYVFIRIRKIEPFFLSAALVTGLLIGLLAFPPLPWYYIALAGVLAIASKNFIKTSNRHVFNPAAFGLFVAGLLLRQPVSWWGVIFQRPQLTVSGLLLFFILVSPAYISIYRLRKANLTLSFLVTFTSLQFLLRFFVGGHDQAVLASTLLSPLVLFFSFVMLPEPMTSPNNSRLQIAFGVFVALVATIASFVPYFFMPDGLIFGLLTGNLVFYKLRQKYP